MLATKSAGAALNRDTWDAIAFLEHVVNVGTRAGRTLKETLVTPARLLQTRTAWPASGRARAAA